MKTKLLIKHIVFWIIGSYLLFEILISLEEKRAFALFYDVVALDWNNLLIFLISVLLISCGIGTVTAAISD